MDITVINYTALNIFNLLYDNPVHNDITEKTCLDILPKIDKNTLDIVNNKKETLLLSACKRRYWKLILELLKDYEYCDLAALDINNRSVLMLCLIEFSNVQNASSVHIINNIIEEILSHPYECSLGTVCNNGFTPLLIACFYKIYYAKQILSYSLLCNMDYVRVETGSSAMHLACYNSMKEEAMILLNHDINSSLNCITNLGYTALSFACGKNLSQVALKILEYPNIQNYNAKVTSDGKTAFLYVCDNNMIDVGLKLLSKLTENDLCQEYNNRTYLMHAIATHNVTLAKEILNISNCNIEFTNNNGATAFDLAYDRHLTDLYMKMIYSYPVDKLTKKFDNIFQVFKQACIKKDNDLVNRLYNHIPLPVLNQKIQNHINDAMFNVLLEKLDMSELTKKISVLTKYNKELSSTSTKEGMCIGCTDLCMDYYCLTSCGHTLVACDDCKKNILKSSCIVCRTPISTYIKAYIC